MMNKQLMSTKERAYAGCIVTIAEQDTNTTKVVHIAGYTWQKRANQYRETISYTMTDALRRLVDQIDTWEGTWKVRTISTPQSILCDMRGRHDNKGGLPTFPESIILSQIGRIDLWERGYADQKYERRSRAMGRIA